MDAQDGLRLCCSHATKSGLPASMSHINLVSIFFGGHMQTVQIQDALPDHGLHFLLTIFELIKFTPQKNP